MTAQVLASFLITLPLWMKAKVIQTGIKDL